jgi:hypothetical protein
MGVEKIAGFYNDFEKMDCEARCLAKAYHLRSLSIDNRVTWRARRWTRFIIRLSQGIQRSIHDRLTAGSIPQNQAAQPSAHPGHGKLA